MLSLWMRLRLAVPLIVLSLLIATATMYGTVTWWSEYGIAYRVLSVIICLVVMAQLGVAVSIVVRPARGVPWVKVGLVGVGVLVTCGLARLRGEF